MVEAVWGNVEDATFEAGLDRVALYVDGLPGVAWSGVQSITLRPVGATPRAFYVDGIKYLSVPTMEELEATLDAYFSPPEFDKCDGTNDDIPGVKIHMQTRRAFGLSFRTRIGDRVRGTDLGYRLYLIYNAIAEPAVRNHTTMSSDATPDMLSWRIKTRPMKINGFSPSSCLMIDSRQTPPELLVWIENRLYGTPQFNATLPHPNTILEWFENPPNYYEIDKDFETGISDLVISDETGDVIGSPERGIFDILAGGRVVDLAPGYFDVEEDNE